MKKNDWILILSTALYSFLFYKEAAGINFCIFSVALSVLLMWRDPSLPRKPGWLIVTAGTILSGAAVAYYGNWLAIWANLISLALLSGISISTRSSAIMTLFHSAYSVASSIVFMILDAVSRKPAETGSKRSPFYVRLLLVMVPLLITLLFFFLYRGANPIFNNFAKNLRFDFITWSWTFFTLLGFILLYGFFYHRRIKELAAWDENTPQQLLKRVVEEDGAGGLFSIRNQYLSGILLFTMLNILLLVVNALDLQYVYITQALPPDLTHSENVHQGVELLIFSIIIAIAIILFVFRGDMNFYSKNKMMRLLAYAWIIQNMFMVVSTIMRNNLYVDEHGLTYKRIGVYVYLALALIGLITTWVKIMRIKSNWYLFRMNTAIWYVLLVIASLISWDTIIARYNITNARTLKALDKNYLIELAPATLPEMLAYNDSTRFLKEGYVSLSNESYSIFRDFDRSYGERTLESKLHGKLYKFFWEREKLGWQSWNYDDSRIMREVMRFSNEGRLKHLALSMFGLENLQPLAPISSNIVSLDLASNQLGRKLEGLALFRNVEKLNLSSNGIDSLDSFPALPVLKELDLSLNQSVRMLGELRNAPRLTLLRLASCSYIDINDLPLLTDLTDLDVSGNTVAGISRLSKYDKLERLSLANTSVALYNNERFPALPSLRQLNLSNNGQDSYPVGKSHETAMILLEGVAKCVNLEELDIAGNALETIKVITDPVNGAPPQKLKTLNLQSNKLNDLSGIEKFSELHTLNISYNQLHSLASLVSLSNLKVLYASNNPLRSIDALNQLSQLEQLDIAGAQNIVAADMRALVNLRWLNVSGTNLKSIEILKEMKKMEQLYLQGNYLESVKELQYLVNLKTLNISGNRIQDYSPLYKLRQLEELYIDPVPESLMNEMKKALPGTKITVMGNAARQ